MHLILTSLWFRAPYLLVFLLGLSEKWYKSSNLRRSWRIAWIVWALLVSIGVYLNENSEYQAMKNPVL